MVRIAPIGVWAVDGMQEGGGRGEGGGADRQQSGLGSGGPGGGSGWLWGGRGSPNLLYHDMLMETIKMLLQS